MPATLAQLQRGSGFVRDESDAKAFAAFFKQYAKPYHFSAFGLPLPDDIVKADQRGELHAIKSGELILAAYIGGRRGRDTYHQDFAQTEICFAKGTYHVKHLAYTPGKDVWASNLLAEALPFATTTWVEVFQEDQNLCDRLKSQGFLHVSTKITAASEIKGIYVRDLRAPVVGPKDCDKATLTALIYNVVGEYWDDMLQEVEQIDKWADHYSYYNERHAWSAISLRGFRPDDPMWIIKPSEMSKKWREENMDLVQELRLCADTPLAGDFPATMAMLRSIKWAHNLERVRFMRLRGALKSGRPGRLLRHSDITDREAGTKDGQVARFHIPIKTSPDVTFCAWDHEGRLLKRTLGVGALYYLDQRKPHMVQNFSTEERIHLVFDIHCDDVVRRLLSNAYNNEERRKK